MRQKAYPLTHHQGQLGVFFLQFSFLVIKQFSWICMFYASHAIDKYIRNAYALRICAPASPNLDDLCVTPPFVIAVNIGLVKLLNKIPLFSGRAPFADKLKGKTLLRCGFLFHPINYRSEGERRIARVIVAEGYTMTDFHFFPVFHIFGYVCIITHQPLHGLSKPTISNRRRII